MGEWRQTYTTQQKFPRVSADVPVRISTVDAEIDPATGRHFFRSAEETTANLSRGGAFVRSLEPLEAGRRVIVEITLPGTLPLQLVAQVAWTQRQFRAQQPSELDAPGFGIQFTGASAAELARLDRYLDSLRPKDREDRKAPALDAPQAVPQT